MNELIDLEEDELRDEMDEYDENLYEVLAPYVLDQEGSYEVLQEFLHDRKEECSSCVQYAQPLYKVSHTPYTGGFHLL